MAKLHDRRNFSKSFLSHFDAPHEYRGATPPRLRAKILLCAGSFRKLVFARTRSPIAQVVETARTHIPESDGHQVEVKLLVTSEGISYIGFEGARLQPCRKWPFSDRALGPWVRTKRGIC